MASTLTDRVKKAWRVLTNAQAPARPQRFGSRMYAAARSSRLTADWNPSASSEDLELVSSLTVMRARSRELIRDASYAKRAKSLVVNNVIGSGIGMQARVMASRNNPRKNVNDAIEAAWEQWSRAENCHMGGRLSFPHIERNGMGQTFEAGEVLIRKHHRAGRSCDIPFSLEVIEAERLADTLDTTVATYGMQPGNQLRMGVELDKYFKPVAYYIRSNHPNEVRFGPAESYQIERVPADQILHLMVIERWPQTRGRPWLHTAMRRINDADGYTEAEIVKARSQATTVGAIETPEDVESLGELQTDGSAEMEMEPGVYKRLNPGEKLNAAAPTAPNSALDPFMRYVLREIAAGAGVSYASLSMDYSQSNYSSSRLALLDDRDLWRFYQSWFISDFRELIHREWLQAAMLVGAIPEIRAAEYWSDPQKFEAVRFKPRGWSWIDPVHEVEAYERAIRDGLTTRTKVISMTGDGMDIEDVNQERADELEAAAELELVFDTDPGQEPGKATLVAAPPPDETNPLNPGDTADQAQNEPAPRRVLRIQR